MVDAVLVGDEDAGLAGGSYVIVQKYLHDLDGWNALPTEAQERIIGRTKLWDIELDDSIEPTSAHRALTTFIENGKEIRILRDNMPFGRATEDESGTYFIGYSRSPVSWNRCEIARLSAGLARFPQGFFRLFRLPLVPCY